MKKQAIEKTLAINLSRLPGLPGEYFAKIQKADKTELWIGITHVCKGIWTACLLDKNSIELDHESGIQTKAKAIQAAASMLYKAGYRIRKGT